MRRPAVLGAIALCGMIPAAWPAAGTCGQTRLEATDAVAAAPRHHKVILENDAVRVLEATVPLHSQEPPHTHPWPSVFFEQTSGANQPWEAVTVRWSEGGPSQGFARSDRYRHNLLVEIKKAGCAPANLTELPPTDAARIQDPNLAVILENASVRVLSERIPPGEKEPWHTHTLPAVIVYFRRPSSQALMPDGTKTLQPELKEMQVTYAADPEPLHSVQNLSTAVYQAYRIELKPTITTDPR